MILRLFNSPVDTSLTTQLNPSLSYLRVSVSGQSGLLVLGYKDDHPMGPISVWYSAESEVLRIQNGYVVGITGTPVEWRQVSFSVKPQWPTNEAATTSFTRSRDVMPGYKFGIADQLTLQRIPAPQKSNYINNPQLAITQNLQWFEAREAANKIPPTRFAVSNIKETQTAVYGEQCFSETFCISWQSWPSTPPHPATKP